MTNTTDCDKEESTTYDHVIKYTGLFGGVQGITMLVSIIRNKIVALLLGPSGVALINIFNNVMKLINQSTNFGVSFIAVKNIAELHENADKETLKQFVNTVRTWSCLTAILGMAACILLSPFISYQTFDNYDYTLSFILLSPILGSMAITGGEMAILKGTKQLKKVALISVFGATATLLITSPIYLFLGKEGIVLSLLLCNIAVLIINLRFSTKVMPWKCSLFSNETIKRGVPMLKLGIAYIIAGVFGQGAEYIIRISILDNGTLEDVGLYNSGYVMAVSYASLVFVAIEADYFPRLSASVNNLSRLNKTVNQQIEVCVLLMAPFLILFALVMPIVVTILFSKEFINSVPMATCATFYMFFKALTLPAAYLPLAKGDSKMYMSTELIYDVFIALAIPFAFQEWGLIGAGFALAAGGLLDFLMIHITYRLKYGYRFSFRMVKLYILQFILLSLTIYAALQSSEWEKWIIGCTAFALSAFISLRILRKETHLISALKDKVKKKFRKK